MVQSLLPDNFVAQVRERIAARLASESLAAADVAIEMKLSKRTLQRRLAAESTNFSKLLDEVRRECALAALTKGGQSCDELAAKLGYQQQSTFTRAVRRWTGAPPTALRP